MDVVMGRCSGCGEVCTACAMSHTELRELSYIEEKAGFVRKDQKRKKAP
jgi:formate hydrogenlyase subunit 6/NADH:ubiquinone oxidoreductase subunit I